MEELIESCISLSNAIDELDAARKLLGEAEARVSRARSDFNKIQNKDEIQSISTPVIIPYQNEFYCIFKNNNYLVAEKAKFIN